MRAIAFSPLFGLLACAGFLPAQDADALYRQGLKLFPAQPQAAAEALQKSLALQPANASAWRALGVVFASLGEMDRAEPAFRNACERDPSLENACLYHGRSLYLLDRFPAALASLRRSLTTRDTAEAHRLIGLSLEALGKTQEAESEFRAALKLKSTSAPDEDPGIDYGVFLYRQGRSAEALDTLKQAAARQPDSSRAQLELGCVLLSLDRLTEAAAALERSLTLRPSPRAHQLLAKTYLRQGKPESAEPHLKQ